MIKAFSVDDPIPVLRYLSRSAQGGLAVSYGEEISIKLQLSTCSFLCTTLGTSINDSSFFGERPFT